MLALKPAKSVKDTIFYGGGEYIYIEREREKERERNTSGGEGRSYVADLQPVSVLEKPQGTEAFD